MTVQAPLSDAAVRDTIAAVFRDDVFRRTLRQTLWQRFTQWVGESFARLRDAASESPLLYWSLAGVVLLLAAAIVGRLAYLAYAAQTRAARERAPRGARWTGAGGDPWMAAQTLAAAGSYTEAAHALYRALLEAVARREQLRLHPSKTVGDYARELRTRSSAVFTRFRDFARTYEVVIYGIGTCDRERYGRLLSLATEIARPRG